MKLRERERQRVNSGRSFIDYAGSSSDLVKLYTPLRATKSFAEGFLSSLPTIRKFGNKLLVTR